MIEAVSKKGNERREVWMNRHSIEEFVFSSKVVKQASASSRKTWLSLGSTNQRNEMLGVMSYLLFYLIQDR